MPAEAAGAVGAGPPGAGPDGGGVPGGGADAGPAGGVPRSALLLREQRGPRSWSWSWIPSRGRGGSRGRGRAGAGSNAMGSADSKLNFRKAVIQLTTKTQVRRGPRPPHPPAGLGAGQGRGGGCANLACPEMGEPAGPAGGTEVRAKPRGLYPMLHPLAPVPHPQPSLPGTSSPRGRCCHLRLTCAYFPSRHRRCPPPAHPPSTPSLQSYIFSLSPPPPTRPPPCSPPCPSVPAGPGHTEPADSMQTKPGRRPPWSGKQLVRGGSSLPGPRSMPMAGEAQQPG